MRRDVQYWIGGVAIGVALSACAAPDPAADASRTDAAGSDGAISGDASAPDAAIDAAGDAGTGPADVGTDTADLCAGVVCSSPPASTDFASCTPGGTFHLPLGGACGGHCEPTTGACTYDALAVPCPDAPSGTELPQDFGWQVVLRAWLASLDATAFDVPSGSLAFDASTSRSTDELFRWWVAVQSPNGQLASLPSQVGLTLPSSTFTLASLEAAAMVGRESPVGGKTAWYATWDDPQNPWFRSDPVVRRAFVVAAADMIRMASYAPTTACTHDPRTCGDNMGGAIREYGAIGLVAHGQPSAIDACALAAYDLGLRQSFATWESFDYSGPNADMTMGGLPGLFTIAEALGDADLRARAAADAADVLSTNCNLAGYCQHQNGTYDASYEGWTMFHVAEAALFSDDPTILDWIERMAALRAYQSLVEPNGDVVGPSHFSPATSAPACDDQADYRRYDRDVALAMLTDEGRYLAFAPGQEGTLDLPAASALAADVTHLFASAVADAERPPSTIPAWAVRHYPGEQEPAVRLARPGTHALLESLRGTDLALPPILRSTDYARRFEGLLVSARSSGLGAIVHFGRVDRTDVGSGLGGGSLSALWTRATGSVVLGWNAGSQAGTETFTWAGYRGWPVHHLVGERGAAPFSSARILDPSETVTMLGGGDVEVVTTGDLGDSTSAQTADPMDVLPTGTTLTRTFHLEGGVLTLTTSVALPSAVTVDALDEAIPLFVGTRAADTITVEARLHGATSFAALSTTPVTNVDEVRVHRGTGTIAISFDAPRRVWLGPETQGSYQWTPRTRPLFVRLASGALAASTITLVETMQVP